MEQVLMRDCPDGVRRADNSNLFKSAVNKSTSYTMLPADSGKLFYDTGATGTVTYTFPSTLPIGWYCYVEHLANQSLVIDPTGTTIDGNSTYTALNDTDPVAWCKVWKGASEFHIEPFPVGSWDAA